MHLDVASPRVAVVCAADDPVPLVAGTFTVTG
jgi:hypothetical protein